MEQKTVNAAPGFECPSCGSARIKLSLGAFLSEQDVSCPRCGTRFSMDKSSCGRVLDLLQDLHVAQRNVAALGAGR